MATEQLTRSVLSALRQLHRIGDARFVPQTDRGNRAYDTLVKYGWATIETLIVRGRAGHPGAEKGYRITPDGRAACMVPLRHPDPGCDCSPFGKVKCPECEDG